MNKKVSIIIRTKNEEHWIGLCLNAIFSQSYKNIEVVIVDNYSTDKTVKKARQWPVKVVYIKKFLPGLAINQGIIKSTGSIIICLSAHCIPKNNQWLASLIKPLKNSKIAGVYGKQEPLSSSSNLDKRDLFIVFGSDRRIQTKDSFFHNANSAFLRTTWKKFPFDSKCTNVEDRIWGEEIIKHKLKICYEPKASVYHYHGIHQGGDEQRAQKIIKILEPTVLNSSNLLGIKTATNDIAIIFDKEKYNNKRFRMLSQTVSLLKETTLFTDIIISAKDPRVRDFAEQNNCKFDHRKHTNKSDLKDQLRSILIRYESSNQIPDSVLSCSVDYLNRTSVSFTNLVHSFYESGMTATIYGYLEKRPCFVIDSKDVSSKNIKLKKRSQIDSGVMITPFGYGFIDIPEHFRSLSILNNELNVIEMKSFNDLEQSGVNS
jgi:rhamnosyltransferase